jgi:TPR repeat protein
VVSPGREAAAWFRRSADQGFGPAQNALGYAYELGKGVPQDAVEACKWFLLAVARADSTAQANLARLKSRMNLAEFVEAEQRADAFAPPFTYPMEHFTPVPQPQ